MSTILRDVLFNTREAVIGELGDDRASELRAVGAASPVEDLVIRTRRALLARA
jgi:hypothetical protein